MPMGWMRPLKHHGWGWHTARLLSSSKALLSIWTLNQSPPWFQNWISEIWGTMYPYNFKEGFFKCIHNLRDQRLCPPMTHPAGFPSGNWGAMLTMRNHKLNVFYCAILRGKKHGDYTENGKESPRNYHETKPKILHYRWGQHQKMQQVVATDQILFSSSSERSVWALSYVWWWRSCSHYVGWQKPDAVICRFRRGWWKHHALRKRCDTSSFQLGFSINLHSLWNRN